MAVFPVFETRQIEDKSKTLENGHIAFRDEVWVKMYVDTRTVVENRFKDVEKDWESRSRNGDPAARNWLEHYKAWKADEEAPVEGTPITEWPFINKAQCAQCKKIGIRSIEQMADAEDNELKSINQGRKLKAAAQAFLETAANTGKVAGEVADLRDKTAFQEQQIEELKAQIEQLSKTKRKKAS